jgi:hypothetical protein
MSDGGPTWSGIILDTNPPDVDHWIPEIESLIETMRKGESAAKERGKLRLVVDDPNEMDEVEEIDPTTIHPDDYLILHQPSGLSPEAENLENLKGGADYYRRLARGKTKEYVAVYVEGKYGSAKEGMPVYPEFMASKIVAGTTIPWHVADGPLTPNKKLPLWLAFDYGLTPCATICQFLSSGQLAVLEEVISTKINPSGMGIKTFGKYVKQFVLANKYAGFKVYSYGDPAGADPSQTDEKSCQDMLREIGLPTKAAPTNLFTPRRQAVADFLGTPDDRYPGMIIDPSAVVLIEGFKRSYKYKAVKVAGEERYKYEADKAHPVSDVHDSLQYNCTSIRKDLRLQKRRPMGGSNKPREVIDQTVGY